MNNQCKNPELRERIKAMRLDGYSAGLIADRLDVTKNVVVGHLTRMVQLGVIEGGLQPRKVRPQSRRLNGKKPRGNLHLVTSTRRTSGWRPRTCQYIAGKPSADDSCKCGAPVLHGSSYCPTHHARCWQKPQARPLREVRA